MSERKGPSASATLFPVGTVQQGNDGDMWVVASTKAGVRRWRRASQKDGAKAVAGGCGCPPAVAAVLAGEGDETCGGAASKSTGSKKRERKGPPQSATLFAIGSKKKGNDGCMWIVTETRTGVKRWTHTPSARKAKTAGAPARSSAARKKASAATPAPTRRKKAAAPAKKKTAASNKKEAPTRRKKSTSK